MWISLDAPFSSWLELYVIFIVTILFLESLMPGELGGFFLSLQPWDHHNFALTTGVCPHPTCSSSVGHTQRESGLGPRVCCRALTLLLTRIEVRRALPGGLLRQ